VSRVYLGASRAVQRVLIKSSKEHGGPSQLLNVPLANETLRRVN